MRQHSILSKLVWCDDRRYSEWPKTPNLPWGPAVLLCKMQKLDSPPTPKIRKWVNFDNLPTLSLDVFGFWSCYECWEWCERERFVWSAKTELWTFVGAQVVQHSFSKFTLFWGIALQNTICQHNFRLNQNLKPCSDYGSYVKLYCFPDNKQHTNVNILSIVAQLWRIAQTP